MLTPPLCRTPPSHSTGTCWAFYLLAALSKLLPETRAVEQCLLDAASDDGMTADMLQCIRLRASERAWSRLHAWAAMRTLAPREPLRTQRLDVAGLLQRRQRPEGHDLGRPHQEFADLDQRGERPNGDNRGSPDIIANPVEQPVRRPTTGHEAVRVSGGAATHIDSRCYAV